MNRKFGHLARLKRAGTRAGKPNYSIEHRYYPDYMPDTPYGISQPLVGFWHMRRRMLWVLGYISIDGKRNDIWETYTPDELARRYELLELCDRELKKGEEKYREKLKEEEKELQEGIMSDIFAQTAEFLEKRKHCLNSNIGENMAKMTFDEMVEWSKKQKDYDNQFNFLKFPQGIHMVRILTDPNEAYFRSYTQHDCGQDRDFRSWLCWDYIMDNKEIREYYDEKELLTEADAKKAKKYGDPVCTTLEVIKKYVKDMEPIYKALRTKTRCVMNVFYVFQAYPDKQSEKTPKTGLYVLEQSAAFNKLIISAMGKEIATDLDGDDDALGLLSAETGKLIAIQVEGEGIGKNRRTYTIDFKGKPGPVMYCEDGSNPYQKGAQRMGLPGDYQIYNLQEVEALRFLPYQEVINQIKSIETIKRVIKQIGYEIPGDEPSDNPLDDNYDKDFAKRTVGKPIKQIKEDSPLSKVQKNKKEAWEDEEILKEEKKKVQSKEVVKIEDDDDIPFDLDELDEFEKKVPPSDPKKEVITNAPKGKRKIF